MVADTSSSYVKPVETEEFYDLNVNSPYEDSSDSTHSVVIHSIGSESALYVQGTINPDDYPEDSIRPLLQIVWDSGSFATVLSKRVFDQLPPEVRPQLDRSEMHVTSASGALINYYGKAEVKLELSGRQYPVTVLVCDIDEDAILGSDFIWVQHSVDLRVDAISKRNHSTRQRRLYVIDPDTPDEHRVPLQTYRRQRNSIRMINNKTVLLKPGEQIILPLHSSSTLDPEETYMVTNAIATVDEESITHVTVLPALVKPVDNRVPVRLINAGEVTAKLVPGEYLAQCTSVKGSYISDPLKRDSDDSSEELQPLTPTEVKKIKRQRRVKVHRIRSQGLDRDPNLKIVPEPKEKSAFVCSKGLFQWKVMPFGLCNAPPTFERLMESILRGLQWEICLVYLDDIIVFGRTFEETMNRLKRVIKAVKEAGLLFKTKKCSLFQRSVQFLGHVVSADGIATDPDKIREISEWPRPEEGLKLGNRRIPFVTQVKSFLGVCSYYRKFIPNFAKLSEPIQRYTRTDNEDTTWSKEAEHAFVTLKRLLTTAPILRYPELNKPFILDTDACDFAMGAVLSQQDAEGREHPIAYMSKVFSKVERNYCIWRKEFQAVYKAVKNFDYYLRNQKFLVRTDNTAVVAMMKREWTSSQTAHMIAFLGQYDMKIEHRRGKSHLVPDGLSRKPEFIHQLNEHQCNQCFPVKKYEQFKSQFKDQGCQTMCTIPIQRVVTRQQTADPSDPPVDEEDLGLKDLSTQALKDASKNDPDIALFIEDKLNSINRPEWREISARSYTYKVLWGSWDQCFVKHGLLYRKRPTPLLDEEESSLSPIAQNPLIQLVLPKKLRRIAFDHLHGTAFGGHTGERKTLGKLRQRFYWPRMSTEVKIWVQQCDTCHANKPLLRKTHGKLFTYVVGLPNERVAADIGGPLPITSRGNKYVLVIGDYFTKWIEAIPVPNQTAEVLARAILDNYIVRFGVPLSLHTDQGQAFESLLWRELCDLLGLKKTRTPPYRPQSDGYIERFNRTLWQMLRSARDEQHQDWDQLVPLLTMAYRSSVNETTGYTPNMMMLGREITLPIDLVIPSLQNEETAVEYVRKLREYLEHVHDTVRCSTSWKVERQKRMYDVTAAAKVLKPGDTVWYLIDRSETPQTPSRKLKKRRRGPYVIVEKLSDVIYVIAKSAHVKTTVHIDQLYQYRGDKHPSWKAAYQRQLQSTPRSVGCDTSDLC